MKKHAGGCRFAYLIDRGNVKEGAAGSPPVDDDECSARPVYCFTHHRQENKVSQWRTPKPLTFTFPSPISLFFCPLVSLTFSFLSLTEHSQGNTVPKKRVSGTRFDQQAEAVTLCNVFYIESFSKPMRSPRPWCHVDYPCGLTPSPGLPGLPGLPVDFLGLPHAPSVTSVSRLPARQFNGGLAPVYAAASLPSQTEQIVWKHGDAWRSCQPLTRRDRQPGSCLLEGGRTVRTTDPDPDYSCPGYGYDIHCTSAVLS